MMTRWSWPICPSKTIPGRLPQGPPTSLPRTTAPAKPPGSRLLSSTSFTVSHRSLVATEDHWTRAGHTPAIVHPDPGAERPLWGYR